ncbi:hypothetical protein K2X85_01040 [bacterium]|nr:hypothetical protein [bacterium]
MNPHDWLAKLEYLEFGLLDDAEERELREQIARDPELARLHEVVRERRQNFRQAARLATSKIDLPTVSQSKPPQARQGTLWTFIVAASLLLAMAVGEQARYSMQIGQLRNNDIRITLVTPTHPPGDQSPVAFDVVDRQQGIARSVPIPYQFVSTSKNTLPPWDDVFRTNVFGRANSMISISDVGGVLKVGGTRNATLAKAVIRREPRDWVTRLTTDRPVYRPGEEILFRSLTLDRTNLRSVESIAMECRLEAPDAPPEALPSLTSEKGVARGSWTIPAEAVPGRYTLSLSPAEQPTQGDRRSIQVERFRDPRLRIKLDLPRQSYRRGDDINANLHVTLPDGKPWPNATMMADLLQENDSLATTTTNLDADGKATIRLTIPPLSKPVPLSLEISAEYEGERESIRRPVPILSNEVDLTFHPESGPLVAGIDQRVFFQARDVNDNPVAVQGRIIDDTGRPATTFSAGPNGRGSMTIRSEKGKRYSIELHQPAGLLPLRPFPEASMETVSLRPITAILGADEPIKVELSATSRERGRLVVATCRGVVVGLVIADDATEVAVPLVTHASGVIRVTLFDRVKEPRRPVAERLVYRRPRHRLQVTGNVSSTSGKSRLLVRVTDDLRQPVPGVIVGASLVDARWLDRESNSTPTQEAHFLILPEIRSPEDFETSDISLDENPDAERELDLVLATHGWRTFTRLKENETSSWNEPDLQVSESADDSSTIQDRQQLIEDQHLRHQRGLITVSAVTAISFVFGWILRRLGWSVRGRLLVMVTLLAIAGVVLRGMLSPVPALNSAIEMKPSHTPVAETSQPNLPMARYATAEAKQQASSPTEPSRLEPDVPPRQEELAAKEQVASSDSSPRRSQKTVPKDRAMEAVTPPLAPPRPAARAKMMEAGNADALTATVPNDLPAIKQNKKWARQFSSARSTNKDSRGARPTLLWEPKLTTNKEGEVQVSFDAPEGPTAVLLRIDAHSTEGRLGSFQQEITLSAP